MGLTRPKQKGPDTPMTQEVQTGAQMKAQPREAQPSSSPSFPASASRSSWPPL